MRLFLIPRVCCALSQSGAAASDLSLSLPLSQDFQSGKGAQGTTPLMRATARVVLGVDSSSLLPRQFEVETPERNLIVKTLEGQDATVRDARHVPLSRSRARAQPQSTAALHSLPHTHARTHTRTHTHTHTHTH
jgi:hypothetical protein